MNGTIFWPAADAWYSQGHEFGDNEALLKSLDIYKRALTEVPRAIHPLYWAMAQNKLGNALVALGEREDSRGRARPWLEEAVAAYRLALEEWTRDRVPLDWAGIQVILGTRSLPLGSVRTAGAGRDRGLKRLLPPHRLALEEWTLGSGAAPMGDDPEQSRDHAPCPWGA